MKREDTVVVYDMNDFFQTDDKAVVKHRNSYYSRIEEYDNQGKYIRTWSSAAEAADYHNLALVTILNCCKGFHLIVRKINKIFLFEEDGISERIAKIQTTVSLNNKASCLEVKEFDLSGNLLNKYPSISKAADANKTFNSTIRMVCKGERLFWKNKIFLFLNDCIDNRLELIKQEQYSKLAHDSIIEYTRGGILKNYWKSAVSIAEYYNIPITEILDCCVGKRNTSHNKIFLFSKDNIQDRLQQIKDRKK